VVNGLGGSSASIFRLNFELMKNAPVASAEPCTNFLRPIGEDENRSSTVHLQ